MTRPKTVSVASSREGNRHRGGADRGLESGGHLDIHRARVRLSLHRVANEASATTLAGALSRHRPAHDATARNLLVIVDDHQAGAEWAVRSLQDTERAARLERERIDDDASGLEGQSQCGQGGLRAASTIHQPEPDRGIWID